MTIWNDEYHLVEFGRRLSRRRIDLGLTQEVLAERAGIGKRTLERMESGASVQSSTLLRVLHELGLIDGLWALLPADALRPMDMLKLRGKQRKRAYAPRSPAKDSVVAEPQMPWKWGDEK
jgi:transcriptional regulator with XRE-family HTH domain